MTRKIAASAARSAGGSNERLTLGNIDIRRDWGWAPEYVEALWLMLLAPEPRDYVICTGETRPLRDFVSTAFEIAGLDWRDHATADESLLRPTDLLVSRGSPAPAAVELKWRASERMRDVVELMVAAELDRATARR